ncbi:endolytic transglycosylase MltG [Patescibacteria group bacterium]|nr:MAG: endolytic transglycosylase MltG [Patescibacteria group bacterium]
MRNKIILYAILVWFSFVLIGIRVPDSFPKDTYFSVPKGSGLSQIATSLLETHLIRSAFLFKFFVVLSGNQKNVVSGVYAFDRPLNLFQVISRITNGEYGLTPIRVTIPEGSNVFETAKILKNYSKTFSQDEFIRLASPHEGYLFPDTYYFLPSITAEEAFQTLRANFNKKIEILQDEITLFNQPIGDVVKMAALLEEEARTTTSRRIIAGILWKRLSIGMPLQVDAAFQYVNGKRDSADLTLDDLKIDSPYNTYLYKGFPPTAITNPGLDALFSAVTPIKTSYLYYLSDKKGEMHYSKTFEEHVVKKNKYLR